VIGFGEADSSRGILMAAWKDRWPLARRWAFLKRPLLALPQKRHTMEVDFCPLPGILSDECGFWLGLVVDLDLDLILAKRILDERPIVQDLAEILSDAMGCLLPCGSFRPEVVVLRDNPEWEQLFPHLGQIGVEVVVTEDLLRWDEKADELIEWLKDRWSTPSTIFIQTDEEPTVAETLLELRMLATRFLFSQFD
jgi:hypothetical protein